MSKPSAFKWKHYQPEVIMLMVRWYLRYNLSLRDQSVQNQKKFIIVWTCSIRYDSVRNICILFSFIFAPEPILGYPFETKKKPLI